MQCVQHDPDDELNLDSNESSYSSHHRYSHEKRMLLTEKLPYIHHLFALAQFKFSFCFGFQLVIELFGHIQLHTHTLGQKYVNYDCNLRGVKKPCQCKLQLYQFKTKSACLLKHILNSILGHFIRFVNVHSIFFLSLFALTSSLSIATHSYFKQNTSLIEIATEKKRERNSNCCNSSAF